MRCAVKFDYSEGEYVINLIISSLFILTLIRLGGEGVPAPVSTFENFLDI